MQDAIYRPNKRLLRIFIVISILLLLIVSQQLIFGSDEELGSGLQNNTVFKYINNVKDKTTAQDGSLYGRFVRAYTGEQEEQKENKEQLIETSENHEDISSDIDAERTEEGDYEKNEKEIENAMAGYQENEKERAAMVIVVQSKSDIPMLMPTIRSYQHRFNEKYNYDWVIISQKSMLSLLQEDISALIKPGSNVKFMDLKYLSDLLTYPSGIDKRKVSQTRRDTSFPKMLRSKNILQERHFARFLVGHFYNLENIWKDYDYYWKVPLGSQLDCDVNYDVFKYMKKNNIKYGWLLMQEDYPHLHRSLFNHVKSYILDPNNNFMPGSGATRNNLRFLLQDDMDPSTFQDPDAEWMLNSCSINPEFELVDLSFFKSTQYKHFFNHIDQFNGFYYETWREPVIKTIATSLFLDTNQVRFFDDLAVVVRSQGLGLCPLNTDFYIKNKCTCDPREHGQKIGVGRYPGSELHLMHKSKCVSKWLQSSGQEAPGTFEVDVDPLFHSFLENEKTLRD